ncbi:response regulator transcription factor [Guggenheimella bovis]
MVYDLLIVDDERELCQSTKEYMNYSGVSARAATSKTEALQALEEDTFSLILLDINLPDGSGYELCQAIRKTSNIPILFISARVSEEDQLLGYRLGGDDFIGKPYSLGLLLAKVQNMLKRTKSEEDRFELECF